MPSKERDSVGVADLVDHVEEVHLPGGAAVAADQPPVEKQAGAEPFAGQQHDDVVRAGANPLPSFAKDGQVGVVLHEDRPRVVAADEGTQVLVGQA